MRKIICALLSILLLCPFIVACNNGNGDGGETAPNTGVDYTIESWMSHSTDKNLGNGEVPKDKKTELEIYMAKGESEGVQISFLSDKKLEGVSVTASGDLDGIDTSYFSVETVTVKGKRWPDPLVPTNGEFTVQKNVIKSVLVSFTTDKNTMPSKERSVTLTVKDAEGNLIGEYKVKITVWNIEYDETPAMDSFTLIYKDSIAKHHDVDDEEEINRLYKLYYDMLLDYKISGGELPYDILDPRADAYMSDPRVTTFKVPHDVDDATLIAYYNKIKENPEWLEKACIYVTDEPDNMDKIRVFEQRVARLRELCPDIQLFVTFYNDFMYDENRDIVQYLMDNVDILATSFACFHDGFLYKSSSVKDKFPTLKDRTDAYKASGKKVWSYVGWDPGPDQKYTNLFVDENGVDHRVLYWQKYDYGSQGFLYWAANYWEQVGNPWYNMATFTMKIGDVTTTVYGDGSLMYNGNAVGVDGACPSLRLYLVRDGLDDYELLTMAEKILGKEATDKIVDKVTRGILTHTGSSDVLLRARKELGNAIEAALEAAKAN